MSRLLIDKLGLKKVFIVGLNVVSCLFFILLVSSVNSYAVGKASSFLSAEEFSHGGFRGFNLDKLRGHTPNLSLRDYKQLSATGANLVRLTLLLTKCKRCSVYEIKKKEFDYLDLAIKAGRAYGFKVIVSFDFERTGKKAEFWERNILKESIVNNWGIVANKYFKDSVLIGYDLINEPVLDSSLTGNWAALANRIIKKIRQVDSNHFIVVEFSPWANVDSFDNAFVIQDSNIIYSLHFYKPPQFTHQGLFSLPLGVKYPGIINNKYYDKKYLSQLMDKARRFIKKNGGNLYVGELGCIRWAIKYGCESWVSDVLEIIDDEGWPWTFHAYRQWHGWDPEFSGRKSDFSRSKNTPIMVRLREYFKKND